MLRNRLHQGPCNGDLPMTPNQLRLRAKIHKDLSTTNSSGFTPDFDECKTHLCFEFISHDILCVLYPYSYKTHNISSKLGFVGSLMKSK